MKKIALFLSLFAFSFGYSQSLPINFEGPVTTSDFVNFDGGTAVVANNPLMAGINTSDSVACLVRDGGAIWGGSKIPLSANLDFSVMTKLSMKVYTTAPVGTVVKFKLEGAGTSVDVDALTTTSGTWETLEWIFAGTPNDLNEIVFMFDFGNTGDGTSNSTFYFDDIEQVTGPPAPQPTALPIDFETVIVSSDFLNFSGATASVIANPQITGINTSPTVGEIVRNGGDFWAGSTILLSSNLDLSTMWHISLKVYTDAPIGTRIKLQLEGSGNSATLDHLTTVTGGWETLDYNFDGQPNDFNRILFMFDFGIVGDGSATSTFLFDDVVQLAGAPIPTPLPAVLPINFESSVVSSDYINEFGGIATVVPNPQINANNTSATVGHFIRSGGQAWARSKLVLTDSMDFSTLSAISMKVYTDAPVGTLLKFKVESTGSGAANERDAYTTVSGDWATYTFDFAGDPPVYNVLTLLFAYGAIGDASPNSTFLIDDIMQVIPPDPIPTTSLPIDFEDSVSTSYFIDFDGAGATVISNPQASGINMSDSVAKLVRNGGQTWAGSILYLENNLDFTSMGYISMNVFTQAPIGTIIKLKLEGLGVLETEYDAFTSVSGAWETLTWDFTGQPTDFNSLVFMFDFGALGDSSATSTFLFDDIMQTNDSGTIGFDDFLKVEAIHCFPNPTSGLVYIQSNHNAAKLVEIIDMSGNVLDTYSKLPKSIDFSPAENGTYLIRVVSVHGVFVQKVVVQH
jgi:hypothetical protein